MNRATLSPWRRFPAPLLFYNSACDSTGEKPEIYSALGGSLGSLGFEVDHLTVG